MWISSVSLISNYKANPIRAIALWIIISIPLVYFLLIQFSQIIFRTLLFDYLTMDPISISIFLTTFQTLSQPIAGMIFGILFWNISRIISYEKDLRTFMIISGIGVLLLFGSNQCYCVNFNSLSTFWNRNNNNPSYRCIFDDVRYL